MGSRLTWPIAKQGRTTINPHIYISGRTKIVALEEHYALGSGLQAEIGLVGCIWCVRRVWVVRCVRINLATGAQLGDFALIAVHRIESVHSEAHIGSLLASIVVVPNDHPLTLIASHIIRDHELECTATEVGSSLSWPRTKEIGISAFDPHIYCSRGTEVLGCLEEYGTLVGRVKTRFYCLAPIGRATVTTIASTKTLVEFLLGIVPSRIATSHGR